MAAVCATLGVGLVVMGLEVTLRGAEPQAAERLEGLLRVGRELLAHQTALADRDVAVFDAYMRARSLPQGNEEEKVVRRQRMHKALTAATEVPLAAARGMVTALELSAEVVGICKPQVAGDVAAGADLLAGGVTAVLRSVDANLPGLDKGPMRKRLEEEKAAILESAAEAVAAVQAAIEERRQRQ